METRSKATRRAVAPADAPPPTASINGGHKAAAVPPARGSSSTTSALLFGALATLAWMLCSSSTILANKRLYSLGFAYPMMVTGLGQGASAAGGALVARLRGERLQRVTPAMVARLAPVVLATAGNAARCSFAPHTVTFIHARLILAACCVDVAMYGIAVQHLYQPSNACVRH